MDKRDGERVLYSCDLMCLPKIYMNGSSIRKFKRVKDGAQRCERHAETKPIIMAFSSLAGTGRNRRSRRRRKRRSTRKNLMFTGATGKYPRPLNQI